MRAITLSAAVAVAALGGCYATTDVGYSSPGYYSSGPSSSVYVSTPDLVTVSPGVQVVADYDEPVFYTDGFYWRFYNNGWYRSNYYASGWNYYERPPVAVLSIERPYAYAHYRPSGYVPRRQGRYQPPERIVRDHRGDGYQPGYRQPPPAAAPGYRQPPPAAAPGYRQPPPAAAPGYRQPPPAAAPGYRQPPPAAAPAARPAARPAPAPAPVVREHH